MSPPNIYIPYIKAKMKYIISQNKLNTSKILDTIYITPPISMNMYCPFLWWIAKGQSWLIKGWSLWSRTSSIHQIYLQSMKLIEHIQQKPSMHRLNGYNSTQNTTQGRVAQCRWWRIHSSYRVYIRLSRRVTRRRRPRCITCKRLYSTALRASFQLRCSLPKEGGTYRSYDMYGLGCEKVF